MRAGARWTLVLCTVLATLAVLVPATGPFHHPLVSSSPRPPVLPAGTPVAGNISGDITWTPSGSPYWIEGVVNLTAGSTLHIDPGVEVVFNRTAMLVAFGSVQALGTEAGSILFRPNATVPGPSDGARLSLDGGSLVARNVTFEDGDLGTLSTVVVDTVVLDRVHYSPGGPIILSNVRVVSITRSEFLVDGVDWQIEHPGGGVTANISYNVVRATGTQRLATAFWDRTPGAALIGNVIEGPFTVGINAEGDHALVVGNEITGSQWGVEVGPNALVARNRIGTPGDPVGAGIGVESGSIVDRNVIWGATYAGIALSDVQNVTLSANTVVSDHWGMDIAGSSNVTVVDNVVRVNDQGILLRGGGPHRVYHNWFLDNGVQAYDSSTGSAWDNGYPSGGNHWSDYAGDDVYHGPGQNLPGPDGIGDAPRPVGPNGVDRYPFFTVPAPGVPRNLTARAAGPDIVLTWEPASMADGYLLNTAATSTGFDFSSGTLLGNVTSWTDAGAAAAPGERYYVLRGHNTTMNRTGPTGNTAGVWAHAFPAGTSTFSLPFYPYPWIDYAQPGWTDTVGELAVAIQASSVAYMDAGGWRSVPGGGDPNRSLRPGEGYVATLPAPALFTFVGLPGAMIDYARWPPYPLAGFDRATTARNLTATVSGDDVRLTWTEIPGFGLANETYEVYVADAPSKLFGRPFTDVRLLATVPATGAGSASTVHVGALAAGPEWFYLVVPVQDGRSRGPSTYSVGVSAVSLGAGYGAVGLPLRPYANGTYLSPPVSSLAAPNVSGLVWFDPARGDWVAHAAWMPPGTYDAPFTMVMAVQIDVSTPMRIVFAGV